MFGVIVLTQIINMDLTQTIKKSEMLLLEGYGYMRDRQPTDGAFLRLLYYKMQRQSWATQRKNKVITVHRQWHDPADTEKKIPHCVRIQSSHGWRNSTKYNICCTDDILRETVAIVSVYNSNQRTPNRTRQQNRPQLSEPSLLDKFEIA